MGGEGERDCRSCLSSVPHREHGNISARFFFSLPFPRHSFIILHRCEAGATLAEARRGSLHAEALIPPLFFFTLSFSPSHERNWVHRVKARSTDLYTSRGLLLNTLAIANRLRAILSGPLGASVACDYIYVAVVASPVNTLLFFGQVQNVSGLAHRVLGRVES